MSRRVARSPEGDALSLLVVRILQLHNRLSTIGDGLAAPAGQSSARWQVLAAVEDAPLSVADVARVLGLTRQSVQRVADALERERYAEYVANPAHQRAKLLSLTPKGRRARRQIGVAQREWADQLGRTMGKAPLDRATRVLTKLLGQLTDD
jgi:DNA-binding MarR family transcriptional regulator